MKTYKKLFSQLVSIENLLDAWNEFKKGKRNKLDVQIFERNLEDNLFSLHSELASKKYNHGGYIGFYVRDPKVRHIHKATARDRVVHHAIFKCINPIFEPTFIHSSYSCRKNKGTHRAVKHLDRAMRKVYQTHGKCFVLKCDIKKFFPTIDHKILLEIISRRIKDNDALWLIRNAIDSFSSEFSTEKEKKGTPIGNLTSQLFVNIYMNDFDQYMKHILGVQYYVRYTDDFVIIHHDKDYLIQLKNEIEVFLTSRLKLSLHPDKVSIRTSKQGIDFLGYVVLPKVKILRTKTKRRIFRKIKLKTKLLKAEKISEESLLQSFNSYLGILCHANCYGLEQKLRHKLWEWTKEFFAK
jgi:retron-type reverse transcriptase